MDAAGWNKEALLVVAGGVRGAATSLWLRFGLAGLAGLLGQAGIEGVLLGIGSWESL